MICKSQFIEVCSDNKRYRKSEKALNEIKFDKESKQTKMIPAESAAQELATSMPAAHDSTGEYHFDESLSEHMTHCYVLESEPSNYLRKHIHELIDKSDELDQLSKEKKAKDAIQDNSWESYIACNANNDTSSFPTKVYHDQNRHYNLFQKYRGIFSRSVRDEPADLPPMTLKVDDSKWKQPKNRLPPRVQSAEKQDTIRDQMTQLEKLNVIRP